MRGFPRTTRPLTLAQQAQVAALLPLVNDVVAGLSRRLPRRVSRDDLRQHGAIGLIHAVQDFAGAGDLQAFAAQRVGWAVLDGLRQIDRGENLHRRRRTPILSLDLSMDVGGDRPVKIADAVPDPEVAIEQGRRDAREAVERCLALVDGRQGEALRLRAAGLDATEVAHRMGGIATHAVHCLQTNGIMRIRYHRRRLAEECGIAC